MPYIGAGLTRFNTADELTVTGDAEFNANANFGDNDKVQLGASQDLQIYHDGSNSYIKDAGTGNLKIQATNFELESATGENMLIATADGAVSLQYDNATKLATTSTGIDVTGTAVTDGLTVAGNVSIDGGTIKLDGNYPTGSNNVAMGDGALDDGSLSGASNTAIGNAALGANTTGTQNTSVGAFSGDAVTTGSDNTFVGKSAGGSITTGSSNTAVGEDALLTSDTASNNVAVGSGALRVNTTGYSNTALGTVALAATTTGRDNTAIGHAALDANTTANNNVAIGKNALGVNTTGASNTAVGTSSLDANTTASNNTAVGTAALGANTTGDQNVAVGTQSLEACTTGSQNVAVGYDAGDAITTGSQNTLIGRHAGGGMTTATYNAFLGRASGSAVTTGSKNTIIGSYNGNQDSFDIRTSSNNIVLSDGDGNAPGYYNSSGARWKFRGHANGYYAMDLDQETSGGSPYGLLIYYRNTAPDNQNGRFISCTDSSTTRFRVMNDGDTQNHDNSFGGISDLKLKEQIADASSQWDDIKALTVRKFKFKTDVAAAETDNDSLYRLGVIAQEVEAAGMSGLVKSSPDIDEDNNDLGTVTKSVKYSILYMKAVKALQEAMTRIETLETKVAALEAE